MPLMKEQYSTEQIHLHMIRPGISVYFTNRIAVGSAMSLLISSADESAILPDKYTTPLRPETSRPLQHSGSLQ